MHFRKIDRRDFCVIQKKKIKILFCIKKSKIKNNTFKKNLFERDYYVPKKVVRNVVLYVPIFLRIFSIFPLECSDMVQEVIAKEERKISEGLHGLF